MINEVSMLSIKHLESKDGLTVLFTIDESGCVIDLCFGHGGDRKLKRVDVVWSACRNDMFTVVYIDEEYGVVKRFCYQMGASTFVWGGVMHTVHEPSHAETVEMLVPVTSPGLDIRFALVCADEMIFAATSRVDRRTTCWRVFVTTRDYGSLRELDVENVIVYGDYGETRFFTCEGILSVYPPQEMDLYSTWNGERLVHIDPHSVVYTPPDEYRKLMLRYSKE